jgi:hypothetical protein
MTTELDVFLSSHSREAREIVLCLRAFILDVFPQLDEQIDAKSGIIAYGYGQKGCKGLVCAIQPHIKHVNLIFSKGTQISDPAHLLVGTGKQARHVKFKSEEEIQNPALKKLFEETLKLDYTK